MDNKQLNQLFVDISYWNKVELEEKIPPYIVPVFNAIDNPDTQNLALQVIQTIKKRFSRISMIHPPIVEVVKVITSPSSDIQHRIAKVLLDLFITNIQENDILPVIEMILEVEDKPNHLQLEDGITYVIFSLLKAQSIEKCISSLPSTCYKAFCKYVMCCLCCFISWKSDLKTEGDLQIHPEWIYLCRLFNYIRITELQNHLLSLMKCLELIPISITLPVYFCGLSSNDSSIKTYCQNYLQKVLPEKQSDLNQQIYLQSIISFCKVLLESNDHMNKNDYPYLTSVLLLNHNDSCYLVTPIFEYLSHFQLTSTTLLSFVWIVTSYSKFSNDLPSFLVAYYHLYYSILKQLDTNLIEKVCKYSFQGLWTLLSQFFLKLKKEMKNNSEEEEIIHCLSSILLVFLKRSSSFVPLTTLMIEDCLIHYSSCYEDPLIGLRSSFYSLFIAFHTCIPSILSIEQAIEAILSFLQHHKVKVFVILTFIEWLSFYDINSIPCCALFIYLIDIVSKIDNKSDMRSCTTRLLNVASNFNYHTFDYQELFCYFSQYSKQDDFSEACIEECTTLETSSKCNLFILIVRCFLCQVDLHLPLSPSSFNTTIIIHSILSFYTLYEKESFLLILDDSLLKAYDIKTRFCPIHYMSTYYYQLIIQKLYQANLPLPTPTPCGILSNHPLASIFTIILSLLDHHPSIYLGTLLNYAYYFVDEASYYQCLIQQQCYFDDRLIQITELKVQYDKLEYLLELCNYLNLFSHEMPSAFLHTLHPVLQSLFDHLKEMDSHLGMVKHFSLPIIHIFCCAILDEPSLLIDFSSIFMNKDNPSDYSFCFAFLPTIIKVLQLSSSSSSSSSSNAFVYREIDYLYDKVTSYCMNNLKPYLYSKETIPSIEQYCHALAEANYYYYSNLHSFLLTVFKKYLCSSDSRDILAGLYILKSLIYLDFQEFDESSYDDDIECFKTIDQLNWKDILFHMNSKQSDGSTTIQFDNVHCLFDCYLRDFQRVCIKLFDSNDLHIRNCCCEILTLLYNFVLHNQMIVSDSPQYLLDSILLNEDIEFTDISSSVTAIYPISSSSSLNYDTLLLVIQEWKNPTLVFAFLQEIFYPILSSSIHQTYSFDDETNDQSIQLSKNLNFLFEEYKLKLSSRKGIDEIDITTLESSALQFYFYSFYEYQPLQLLCQQIFKKIRGNQSETTFLLHSLPTLIPYLYQSFHSSSIRIVNCALHCLDDLLAHFTTPSLNQLCVDILPILLSKRKGLSEGLVYHIITIVNELQKK